MKIKFQNQNNLHVFMMLFIALAMSFTACNKDNNDSSSAISDEEAAAVLEGALSTGTSGIAGEISDATYIAVDYTQKDGTGGPCGMALDSTVVRNANTALVTAAYTTTWHWVVNWNNLMVPSSLDYSRTANGQYETLRMISDDNVTSAWTVGNLLTGSAWTYTGTYHRNGSQTSKIRNQNAFTSELTITITSLNVNKNTLKIESGTGTFTLTGSGTGGNNFSFTGGITFNGDGTATVTINGQTYVINLN